MYFESCLSERKFSRDVGQRQEAIPGQLKTRNRDLATDLSLKDSRNSMKSRRAEEACFAAEEQADQSVSTKPSPGS
jgi:hypothetical protein